MTMSATDLQSLIMAVGEMRGQLREIVHTMNNMAQALNAATTAIAKLETIPANVAKVEADVASLEKRVAALEVAEHKRKGAISFWGWFIQSPVPGVIVAIGTAVWVFLKGKSGQ